MQNEQLTQTIEKAIEVKNANRMDFVTIWKTGKSFGFNFEKQPVGYTVKEYGVTRKVVGIY